jgi:hypothetical protein
LARKEDEWTWFTETTLYTTTDVKEMTINNKSVRDEGDLKIALYTKEINQIIEA